MRATIQDIEFQPGSGLATLVVLDEVGDVQRFHADAGPLFRAVGALQLAVGLTVTLTFTDFGTVESIRLDEEE